MPKAQRLFRGIPVYEARASIHVQPNQKDIDGATQEDPTNCAYARCIKRTLETPNVFVFKTVAFIQTLDESGRPIMERFVVKKYARAYIVKFDSGRKVDPGGFVFHHPPRSKTLKYKLAQARKRYQRSPRRVKGAKLDMKKLSLRSGKGRVHLFGNEDQIKPLS